MKHSEISHENITYLFGIPTWYNHEKYHLVSPGFLSFIQYIPICKKSHPTCPLQSWSRSSEKKPSVCCTKYMKKVRSFNRWKLFGWHFKTKNQGMKSGIRYFFWVHVENPPTFFGHPFLFVSTYIKRRRSALELPLELMTIGKFLTKKPLILAEKYPISDFAKKF